MIAIVAKRGTYGEGDGNVRYRGADRARGSHQSASRLLKNFEFSSESNQSLKWSTSSGSAAVFALGRIVKNARNRLRDLPKQSIVLPFRLGSYCAPLSFERASSISHPSTMPS